MKRYVLGFGLLLSLPALTAYEKFLDVNNNPNNPVVSMPNFLLLAIIANGIQTQMFTVLHMPYITQYVVSRTANSGGNDQYFFTNANSTIRTPLTSPTSSRAIISRPCRGRRRPKARCSTSGPGRLCRP